MSFEPVIGLEVHVQLATDTKIFCACRARWKDGKSVGNAEPNINTCPICVGHPGTLPVLNQKAVEYILRAGLALECSIRDRSVFARKNYFYPDLPKGYQISQFDLPVCENGTLKILGSDGKAKSIRIKRIHLEEDAGKNVHFAGYSLVNLNRAGVPLAEIVSEPDLSTPEEAGQYLRLLHAVVTYLGICDGNLQEGNFRCDANVSVRPSGTEKLGTRVEIKNINSFKFIEKAIAYEIARQTEVIKAGGRVVQETRLFDSARGVTQSMRSKEEAEDYRYFPDPDLLPISLGADWIESVRKALPELPSGKQERYQREWGLPPLDAQVLTSSRPLATLFEKVVDLLKTGGLDPKKAAKPAANWLAGEVTRLLGEHNLEPEQCPVPAAELAELVRMTLAQELSSTGAKQALASAWKTGKTIRQIVESEGLKQVSDRSALGPAIDAVLAAHPAQVAELQAGKEKVMGYLVGQVMKATQGKANPSLVQEEIRKRLGSAN